MEARLYAEDPEHGYLPSVGRITHLHWPMPPPVSGWISASTRAMSLDVLRSMLGKARRLGESRGEAVDRLHKALATSRSWASPRIARCLLSVLADGEFRRGA